MYFTRKHHSVGPVTHGKCCPCDIGRRNVTFVEPTKTKTTNRILDAAQSVMESADLSRFTIEAVSRSAGLSRQTIYRYFESVRTLGMAVLHRQEQVFLAGLQNRFSAADSPADALRDSAKLALGVFRPLNPARHGWGHSAAANEQSAKLLRELFSDQTGPAVPAHTVQSAADTFMRLIESYLLAPNGLTDRQIADRITAVVLPALTND